MAWLNTTPVPKDKGGGTKPGLQDKRSRRVQMEEAGQVVPEPDCPLPYLVEYLLEIGPIQPGGIGLARIGWGEIAAWCAQVHVALQPWEARLLRRLSGDYLAAQHAAEDPACPPPWREEQQEQQPETKAERLNRQIDAFFAL